MLLTSRLIRFQFRQGGIVHLATCHDGDNYHVVSGTTLCEKRVSPGQGGWGHSHTTGYAFPKKCKKCWGSGQPAEHI